MNEYNDMHMVMVESNNLGILFCRQGNYRMAVMFHLQALKIAETVMGKLSKDYCDCLYNLGNTCADAGDYDMAIKYLLAAEQSSILRGVPDDMGTVHLLNSIAYAMEESGDYSGAIARLESALVKLSRLAEHDEGLQADDQLRNTYYLAGVCEKAGEPKKALSYYYDTLFLIKKFKLPYYPTCLNSIANVLAELGNADKSLEMRVEAMHQIKTVIGPKSISYAQSLRNLAVVYRSRGNYEKAKEYMQEAIDIKRAVLGLNSKETLREILFLIELYASSDDTDTALEIFIRLLAEIGDDFVGRDEIIQELANLYMSLGDINRLNELYNKAVEMYAELSQDDEEP